MVLWRLQLPLTLFTRLGFLDTEHNTHFPQTAFFSVSPHNSLFSSELCLHFFQSPSTPSQSPSTVSQCQPLPLSSQTLPWDYIYLPFPLAPNLPYLVTSPPTPSTWGFKGLYVWVNSFAHNVFYSLQKLIYHDIPQVKVIGEPIFSFKVSDYSGTYLSLNGT